MQAGKAPRPGLSVPDQMGCLWISYFGQWPLQASAAYHPPSGQVGCWLHFLAGLAVGRIVKHPKKQ